MAGRTPCRASLRSATAPSHFDRTYSVDLRYYRNYMGSDFSLSDYLRRNSITKVLLIGNVDYYISPDFALEN